MTTRRYSTAAAFKQALERRLRDASKSGPDFARRRQLVVFDRFLARVVLELGDAATLKGGLAVELQLERARTTKDVDLRVMGAPDAFLDRLRAAANRDLGDFMLFVVRPDDRHPEIQNDGMQYGGMRFQAECSLAGKIYGRPFGVDAAFGDPIFGEPVSIVAEDVLGFAGITPPTIRVYPMETHIAEKLHAYTMPRGRPNTRVKDLPDLALIATARALDARRLRSAIEQTFAFRRTHDIPERVPEPPDAWEAPYASLARLDQLRWATLADVFEAARSFLDPVLAGSPEAAWDPETWSWSSFSQMPSQDQERLRDLAEQQIDKMRQQIIAEDFQVPLPIPCAIEPLMAMLEMFRQAEEFEPNDERREAWIKQIHEFVSARALEELQAEDRRLYVEVCEDWLATEATEFQEQEPLVRTLRQLGLSDSLVTVEGALVWATLSRFHLSSVPGAPEVNFDSLEVDGGELERYGDFLVQRGYPALALRTYRASEASRSPSETLRTRIATLTEERGGGGGPGAAS